MSIDHSLTKKLKERHANNIRVRTRLGWLLFFEFLIFLLMNPGFLGVEIITEWLTIAAEFLGSVLWPASYSEMDTYKGLIFNVCTWVTNLPIYPMVEAVAPWVFPVWFVWNIVFAQILKVCIKKAENPPDPKPDKPKPEKKQREQTPKKNENAFGLTGALPGMVVSGLDSQAAEEANAYCLRIQDHVQNDFRQDPGIRVQVRATDPSARNDYLVRWNKNHEIILEDILYEGRIHLILKNDQAYLRTSGGEVPLTAGEPKKIWRNRNDKNKSCQCVLTWLGGR